MKVKVIILAMMFLAMVGCSSIPLSAMYKMMSINPLENDPQHIVVAVQAPNGIEIGDDDIAIKFDFFTDKPESSFRHSFYVKSDSSYVLPDELKQALNDESQFFILKLSKPDALKMAQAQQAVKQYRMKNDDGAGSFNLIIESVCKNDDFSVSNDELNVYLKLRVNDEFFMFLDSLSVFDIKSMNSNKSEIIYSCR